MIRLVNFSLVVGLGGDELPPWTSSWLQASVCTLAPVPMALAGMERREIRVSSSFVPRICLCVKRSLLTTSACLASSGLAPVLAPETSVASASSTSGDGSYLLGCLVWPVLAETLIQNFSLNGCHTGLRSGAGIYFVCQFKHCLHGVFIEGVMCHCLLHSRWESSMPHAKDPFGTAATI